jgi:S-adenosylmethionine:tRNA ribosyltransferase-isomerase
MTAAGRPDPQSARLLAIDASGTAWDLPRTELASRFRPGDLVVANDAATLPASLQGTHVASGAAVEVRLARWV